MKSLDISFVDIKNNLELKNIDSYFNNIPENEISIINWKDFSYLPNVSFRIFYSKQSIFIKYSIFEQSILAQKLKSNDSVYQDSCVEFFVSPGDGNYYNFEFNCIGTSYLGCGASRETRNTVSDVITDKIKTYSTLGTEGFSEIIEDTKWSLITQIPLELFTNKSTRELKGSSMKANFYKCGDQLSVPHYVTWNSIKAEKPDFHRPECFGEINFK